MSLAKILIRAIIVAVLTAFFSSALVRYLFPAFTDPYPPNNRVMSIVGGVIVWGIAVTVSFLDYLIARRRATYKNNETDAGGISGHNT